MTRQRKSKLELNKIQLLLFATVVVALGVSDFGSTTSAGANVCSGIVHVGKQ
jgi:hypothetical protein